MENSAFVTITKLKGGKKKNDQLIWNPDEEGGYFKKKNWMEVYGPLPKTLTLFVIKTLRLSLLY